MLRLKLHLPQPLAAQNYTHQDLIHDAIIHALDQAGVNSEDMVGRYAKPWTFAALGWHQAHQGFVRSLIISSADPNIARALTRLQPEQIVQRRWNGETINFSGAIKSLEFDPIFPNQTRLDCLLLSPLVLQDYTQTGSKKYWHKDLRSLPLSEIISRKLSKQAGRDIQLQVTPDSLYLRANPEHSVLVNLKQHQNGSKSFVIGMQAPLILEGAEDDLRFAWYAGIGEKTRNGFGCLGLAEQGVHS